MASGESQRSYDSVTMSSGNHNTSDKRNLIQEEDGLVTSSPGRRWLKVIAGGCSSSGGNSDDRDESSLTGENRDDSNSSNASGRERNNSSYMGTLTGVFSPVALSMFSSLLFLGVGYIVGNAGTIYSIALLCVAYFILCVTILSICAIATNGAVQGGGVYFMISRTLGPELGGSIGVLFWAANTVGSALFATGCIEAVINSIGPKGVIYEGLIDADNKWIELGLNWLLLVLITCVAIVGPGMFGKFILLFLLVVVVCTLTVMWSFFGFFTTRSYVLTFNETTVANCTANCTYEVTRGAFSGLLKHQEIANFTPVMFDDDFATFSRDCHNRENPVSVFTVFGVLFSGVTGILAGANLSGELKNPSASIPRGTIAGTAFTFVTYLALFILTSATCERNLLYHECLYMYYMDMWGPFVAIGTMCATLCASLSCLLGASRVIHAVGKDNMFGAGFQSINRERKGNPIVSVVFTAFMVGLLFFYGSLNAIAQLCSVLYLLSYAAINASCFFLDAFSAPNFRPTFKYFHASGSLVGFVLSLVTMFAINYACALIALFGCLVITVLLGYFSPAVKNNNWGSIMQNLLLHQVRKYLLKLDLRKEHVKYWRPHIILLVKNPRYECSAIHFVNAMKKGGLYVLGHVNVQNFETTVDEPPTWQWLDLIDHLKIKAFAETTVAKTYREGVQHLVRISGVGALKPNTAVLKFHEESRLIANEFTSTTRKDFFRDKASGFASDKMHQVFPEGSDGSEVTASPETIRHQKVEFVRTITDILKIGKNVCIYRNFDRLNHPDPRPDVTTWGWYKSVFRQIGSAIVRTGRRSRRQSASLTGDPKFIDVWFVNFFAEPANMFKDRWNLFMLQMAYIVSISSAWKPLNLKLRVMYRVMDSEDSPDGGRGEVLRKGLQSVLKEERIKAVVAEVPFDQAYQMVKGSLEEEDASNSPQGNTHQPRLMDIMKIPDEYVRFCNGMIRDCSDQTAVSFIHLPAPPSPSMSTTSTLPHSVEDLQIRYLKLLSELTKGLPPTMMVHGIHAVTSTAL